MGTEWASDRETKLRDGFRMGWTVLLFGWIWFLLCRNLAVHWLVNTQYTYGWLVPPFSLYLVYNRWMTRPEPGVPLRSGAWLAAAAALAFFPTWLIAQPNPDWRSLNWIMTAETVAITLGTIACAGGVSWVRHFAFPVCFIFTAVPWPRPLEIPMIQGLMQGVAAITVEILNLVSVTAVRHGNLIEMKCGLLGIDEACSGVRSLQAALMASLFLGELSRFNLIRRVVLVLTGLAIALVSNVARTLFLSWSTARGGIASLHWWHDRAGFTILAACFLGVWVVAIILGRRDPPQASVAGVPRAHPLPSGFLPAFTLWFSAVFVGTEIWFYDSAKPPESPWRLVPPAHSTPMKIAPAAAEDLQADRTTTAAWTRDDGSRWQLLFFEWKPGPMRSRVLAQLHRPDSCLTGMGLRLVENRGTLKTHAGGFDLEFRAYTFEANGRPQFVYHGTWENRYARSLQQGPLPASVSSRSIQTVLRRERDLGQQIAELVVSGYATGTEADAALQQEIQKLLVPRNATPR